MKDKRLLLLIFSKKENINLHEHIYVLTCYPQIVNELLIEYYTCLTNVKNTLSGAIVVKDNIYFAQ